MSAFAPLARALAVHDARYVLIGVWGANFHAHRGGVVFTTQDWDLFMPPDPDNLLATWNACRDCGLDLSSAGQPLDQPTVICSRNVSSNSSPPRTRPMASFRSTSPWS